ncbi:tubulin polyglutamylase TTLL4-like isoform X2 [Gigantopelta aegis]|uniref:tubulin polyglutamylase TTLL4-like isoform X2 n=1 Tax=Gigantopelta aegis TaxID=1735272 RepID=UPI001B88D19B|nr:tubulin polyglutamylase TTLL4-like isoform X2 [Gigantopelta aegis]
MADRDFSLAKLTENLEELSLKKQLPLRSQAQKPVLKYNTHVSKPISLINPPCFLTKLVSQNRNGSKHGVPPRHSAARVKDDGGKMDYRPPKHGGGLGSGASTQSMGCIPHQKAIKSHSNPYTRPLSAKEVADDIKCYRQVMKNTSSHASSPLERGTTPNGILQLNSFMRPQSAAVSECAVKPKSPRRVKLKALGDSGTAVHAENGSHNSNKNNHFKTAHTDKGSVNSLFTKPPLSTCMSQTRSLALLNFNSSVAEQRAKIRNLNYTPTRPYSEVSEPHSDSNRCSPSSTCSSNRSSPSLAFSPQQSSPPATKTVPLSEVHCKPSHNLTATTTINTEMVGISSFQKMPVTNTITGTVYYKKGSKPIEDLCELRPMADGAPAKLFEKSDSSEDEESDEESEDNDSAFPSGERLPGDGETSLDDFDEEDDGIDGLDDDCVDASDIGESDGYSVASNFSRQSTSSIRSSAHKHSAISEIKCRPLSHAQSVSAVSQTIYPALRQSLFPSIPPTINFVPEGERVERLPWEMRKLMKWRMSPITPNIVKSTLARVGFRITKRNNDWLGCFGKHMKSQGFKAIREYQKLNHFPGSFQIGRKDRLWRNLCKMQLHFGKKEFGFFPQTYVLPFDLKLLKRAWEEGGCKQKWIIKPPASARGIGIKVIHKWNQIPRRKPVIVQRYLSRPYLINDSKFDMRLYVYVSCYDPLRIYIYEDGLARFASCKYSSSMKTLNNKFMHLTNYSVNKKNIDYQSNSDEALCQGHKWSLKSLWHYLKQRNVNTAAIWETIKDLVIKTVICSESPINSMIKANVRSRYCVHELFGFDILLDDHLKPWILEVNISPSLHSNSPLDINIKGHMISDLLNIAGFLLPDKHDITHHVSASSSSCDLSSYSPPNSYCMDKRLFTQQFSPHERAKHAYYCQRHQDEQILQTILDTLTPDDLRILTQSIDEDNKKGRFQRIFPTPTTHRYLKFFDQPRYYNLLLDQWVQRFNKMEYKGIALLESLCEEGLHLESVTDDPSHQWNPPSCTITGFWENRTTGKTKENEPTSKLSTSLVQLSKVSKAATHTSQRQSLAQTISSTSVNNLSLKVGSQSQMFPKSPTSQRTTR